MATDDASGQGALRGLRRSNERGILEALGVLGPSSQAQLARELGLSRSGVNAIVKSLEAQGEVVIRSGVSGRETEVALAGPRGTMIAIDLGHQRLHGAIVLFDREERFDEVAEIGREHDAALDVSAVARLVDRLIERAGVDRSDISRVCVGVHAPYESGTRTISPSGILAGWAGLDVEATISESLGLAVMVDNDANLAALAEWTWGSARGTDDLLYVKSSNGIGSGLIINDKIFRGANGLAGELGHVVVDDRGALCNCGNRGCLSAVASGRAILLELQAAGAPRESLQQVITDARAGDLACRRILGEAGRSLGRGLAHVVNIVAPSTIVLGGELAAAGALVLEPMRAELAANTLQTRSGGPRIEQGILRGDMCVLGCVAAVVAERMQGLGELPAWLLVARGELTREPA